MFLLGSSASTKPYPTPAGIPLGITASAILYPTPISIPLGITASAILSTGDYRTGDYRTGDYRHRAVYEVPLLLVEVVASRLDELSRSLLTLIISIAQSI